MRARFSLIRFRALGRRRAPAAVSEAVSAAVLATAAAAAVALLLFPDGAAAQPQLCRTEHAVCAASCQKSCEGREAGCFSACKGVCDARLSRCVDPAVDGAPAGEAPAAAAPAERYRRRATQPAAPSPAPAPSNAYEAAPRSARVQSLDASEPLNSRIYFMPPGEQEPDAEYYGYLLIGEKVPQARKNAVAKAIACSLEALPDAAAAAQIERLGLFSLPALRAAGATEVTPADVLAAYDFARAARWLRAAGYAAGTTFDPETALVFVASQSKRARQMDNVVLPGGGAGDPVIADGSGLTGDFAAAWVAQLIRGLENRRVRSRQDLQQVMEVGSWLDWVGAPLFSLFTAAPAADAAPPPICP